MCNYVWIFYGEEENMRKDCFRGNSPYCKYIRLADHEEPWYQAGSESIVWHTQLHLNY